eukprot:UC1_evm1s2106
MASLWEQLYDAERFRRLLRTNFWDTLSQVLSLLNTMASADERACVAMFVIEDVPTELFGEILSLCDPDNRPLDAAPEDELVKQEYLANIIGTLTNDSDLRDVCASNLIPVLVRMCRLPWPTLSCLAMIGLSNYAIDPVHRARLVTDGAVDWLVPLLYSPDSKVLFDASILMGMMAVSVDMPAAAGTMTAGDTANGEKKEKKKKSLDEEKWGDLGKEGQLEEAEREEGGLPDLDSNSSASVPAVAAVPISSETFDRAEAFGGMRHALGQVSAEMVEGSYMYSRDDVEFNQSDNFYNSPPLSRAFNKAKKIRN